MTRQRLSQELIVAARAGSERAWFAIHSHIHDAVWRATWGYGLSDMEREDDDDMDMEWNSVALELTGVLIYPAPFVTTVIVPCSKPCPRWPAVWLTQSLN